MTEAECRRLMADMAAIWKNYKPLDVQTETRVWMRYLGEYTYPEVNAALDAYVVTDTKGFPPSPGQLLDRLHSTRNSGELTASEAWALVSRAIKRSGYYSREEFEKLPQAVRKAVGSPDQLRDWALDESYVEGVAKGQFSRAYESELAREHEYQKMPENVKALIRKAEAGRIGERPAEQIGGGNDFGK